MTAIESSTMVLEEKVRKLSGEFANNSIFVSINLK